MARSFNGSTQYLSRTTVITGYPCTIAAWWNSGHVAGTIANITALGALNDVFQVEPFTDGVLYFSTNGVGYASAPSVGTFTANVWNHACGVWAGTTDHRGFLNGVRGTDDNTNLSPTSLTHMHIGQHALGTYYLNGLVAEVAYWNVALTDAEVAILAKGFSPRLVRPQNLVSYAPLVRGLQDLKIGNDWTDNGSSTVADHPPVIYPSALTIPERRVVIASPVLGFQWPKPLRPAPFTPSLGNTIRRRAF